jgi:hypothetical protein
MTLLSQIVPAWTILWMSGQSFFHDNGFFLAVGVAFRWVL